MYYTATKTDKYYQARYSLPLRVAGHLMSGMPMVINWDSRSIKGTSPILRTLIQNNRLTGDDIRQLVAIGVHVFTWGLTVYPNDNPSFADVVIDGKHDNHCTCIACLVELLEIPA